MARKSRIKLVKELLEEIYRETQKSQESAAKNEQFREAAIYKGFKDAVYRVIKLCGEEKPKEDKKENE